jgi:hypothetical protein
MYKLTGLPLHYPGNGLGSRAPSVPILDPQVVSQNSIQGDRRQGGEALPLKAHAGAPFNSTSQASCIERTFVRSHLAYGATRPMDL